MIERDKLEEVLAHAGSLTIGLLGDLFLDRYLEIAPDLHERSIETGLEAYQVERVRNVAGALGTVMNNLAALGVRKIVPVTMIGDDGHGFDLRRAVLPIVPVVPDLILQSDRRLTPTYTKPIKPDRTGVWRELNRFDVRSREPLAEGDTDRICHALTGAFPNVDGWIILDQVAETDFGVVNNRVRALLESLSRAAPAKLVFVDSRAHIGCFRTGILKGNVHELTTATGVDPQAPDAAARATATLAGQTGQSVYCTRGELGILVAEPNGTSVNVPTVPVSGPIDIVGAGDSATSAIVMALLAGATGTEAAAFANLVASITVQQIGTTGTASPREVLRRWDEMH